MASWSTRRKATYLSIVLGAAFVLIVIPFFIFFYDRPTCYDGKRNGDETGIDCGGSCQLLCSFEAIEPNIIWSRAFRVTNSVYSAVAYIENRNINSEAAASYIFNLYDRDNVLIASREGRTLIPKNKLFAIFEPNIETGEKIPYRVSFNFKDKLVWKRNFTPDPEIVVTNKSLTGADSRPRIDATIENRSLETIPRIETVAIVFDSRENAIGASRTVIDELAKDESKNVTFTWPLPFQSKEEICRVPATGVVGEAGEREESLGVVIAIDRSGSMSSLGKNPPQPLTDVKTAALSFLNLLKGTDQIGLVSFATTASEPIDSELTSNYENLKSFIGKISIMPEGTQYTNLGEAIEKAAGELLATGHKDLTERVLILLTDGIATRPEKAGEKNYPSIYAEEKATAAKKNSVEIYIIGLGNEVSKEFLQKIATSPEHYFPAATAKELTEIYKKIAVKICKVGPSVIEVIPRAIPVNL